jgi:hypothetical protein
MENVQNDKTAQILFLNILTIHYSSTVNPQIQKSFYRHSLM